MIKDNEIRIGNLVLDSTKNTTIVESIIPEDNRVRYGIPLTEEWVVNFGLKLEEDAGNWNEPDYKVYKNDKYFRLGMKDGEFHYYNSSEDDYYSTFYPKFLYVHQLQNFFFAKYGEELTLK